MSALTPLYTRDNCSFCCPLEWGVSVFWRSPVAEAQWLDELAAALEPDGIRVLGHRFVKPGVSQFAVSTKPDVAPLVIVQRVKGRLQYAVRRALPKALKRNFAIRSFGHVTREVVEAYVASQLNHHRMADDRVQQALQRVQIEQPEIDLSPARQTSHGLYWHNLHVVLVHRERWAEIRDSVLDEIRAMILRVCQAKRYLLSRRGILADHLHLALGCPFEVAPTDVALSFLNNLAFIHGMRAVYQYGAFVGTFGEYDERVVVSDETPHHGDKPRGGEGIR